MTSNMPHIAKQEPPSLAKIIDVSALQLLMNQFYEITQLPMSIVDLKGTVLVGVGWQRICTDFHRVNPVSCRNCQQSDLELTTNIKQEEYKIYKCNNKMWDIATPIMVGGQHLGNLFMGQFFFDDEEIDVSQFKAQAKELGFDEQQYLEALMEVPRFSREKVESAMRFFLRFAGLISSMGLQQYELRNALDEQAILLAALYKSEETIRTTLYSIGDAVITTDLAGRVQQMNVIAEELTGWREHDAREQYLGGIFNIINETTRKPVALPVELVLHSGEAVGMDNHTLLISKQGNETPIADSAAPIRNEQGDMTGVVLVFRDVTDQWKKEKERRKHAESLKGIIRIIQHDSRAIQEFLDYALQESLNLSGSKIGYIYFYDERKKQFILNSWSKEVMKECSIANPKNCYELDKTGIWGEAVRQGKPIIVNNFQEENPFKKGYPEGHANLNKYLTIPVFSKGEIVAVVGVANKEEDYEESDALQLTILMETVLREVEGRRANEQLRKLEWMLGPEHDDPLRNDSNNSIQIPMYGNLTLLNTSGLILGSIGEDLLKVIAEDYLSILGTSTAIYERSGDYALGIFSSGWCRFMDQASRNLCNTDDNKIALSSGKWLCHESCWKNAALVSLETGKEKDIECEGGIHLYALPIKAGGEIIGSINFGYGDPPSDPVKIMELAKKYDVSPEELQNQARAYETRPPYIIRMAKERLAASARLIGEIVERKLAEDKLARRELDYQLLFDNITQGFALHEIILDNQGNPIDYRFLKINPAFERLTGLKASEILGKTVLDVLPETEDYWIQNYGKVALTGNPLQFEDYSNELKRYYEVWAFCPQHGKFAVIVNDVTSRRLAEEALKSSDRIFKHALDMLCLAGFDGYFKILNPSWSRVLGWSEEELLSKPWTAFVHPEDVNFTENISSQIIDGKEVYQFENRYICKDGSTKWLSWNSIPYPEENVMYGVARDITAQKEAEVQLFESKERLQSVIRVSPVGIGIVKDRIILEVNPRICAMTGYSNEELIGKNSRMLYLNDAEFERVGNEKYKQIKDFGIGTVETLWKMKNGNTMYILLSSTPLLASDHSKGFTFTALDITDIKQSEKLQRVLFNISNAVISSTNIKDLAGIIREELGQLIDTTNFYIAFYDEDTQMLEAPFETDDKDAIETWPAKNSMTGYVIKQRKPILATSQDVLKLVDEGEIEIVGTPSEIWLGVPLFQDQNVTGVMVVQSYDNPWAFNQESVDLLGYASHHISIALQRQKAYEDLIIAKEKAEESDRLKTAFLNNMSHEIRTPLNGLLGFSSLLCEPGIGEEDKKHYAEVMERSGKRLLSIISDIISIATVEAGQEKLKPHPCDLREIFKDLGNQFSIPMDKRRDLILVLNNKVKDSDSLIIADETKLSQILANLIGNAIKFTPQGQILVESEKRDDLLYFHVSDTGIGISAEYHEKIFERFQQIDSNLAREQEGAGLGLALSKAYVELMGGTIHLESEPGQGSVFSFFIPYLPSCEPSTLKTPDLPLAKALSEDGYTILVAEDELSNFQLIDTILRKSGCKVIHVDNGLSAIEACQNNPQIDLILMDVKMPVMNGYEATRKIKAFRPQLPIIALTAYALKGSREESQKEGCDDYLSKPIFRKDLFAVLGKFLLPSGS